MASDEIKACPFCGVTDVRVVDSSRGWRAVRCYKCFARGPADQSDASPIEDAELIAAWNRRAESPAPSALVEAADAMRAQYVSLWQAAYENDELPDAAEAYDRARSECGKDGERG